MAAPITVMVLATDNFYYLWIDRGAGWHGSIEEEVMEFEGENPGSLLREAP